MSSVIHPHAGRELWETIDTSPMVIYHGSANDERGIDLATMRMKGLLGQLVEGEARGANARDNSI